MQQRRALGRGLESLIPGSIPQITPDNIAPILRHEPLLAPINAISPNRQQPRQTFDEEKIRELAESIREQGIIQPLIVSELKGGRYELVAGERRLRACRMLGMSEVPVIIKNVDEEKMLSLALIENVQREDLNPIEEARAMHELMEQFNYSQEEVSKKVGKSRSHTANSLRLLKLPQIIQDDLASGRYSAGHARALLALPNTHEQLKFRETLLNDIPSVRDIELLVQQRVGNGARTKPRKESAAPSPQLKQVLDDMVQALGTKVRFKPRQGGGGQLVIEFYSAQEFDRIYHTIVR